MDFTCCFVWDLRACSCSYFVHLRGYLEAKKCQHIPVPLLPSYGRDVFSLTYTGGAVRDWRCETFVLLTDPLLYLISHSAAGAATICGWRCCEGPYTISDLSEISLSAREEVPFQFFPYKNLEKEQYWACIHWLSYSYWCCFNWWSLDTLLSRKYPQ